MKTAAFALLFALSCAHAPERGLLPRNEIAGRPFAGWTLAERMAYWNVPAVDIAVIDGGKVVFSRTYGAPRGTLFQAGSISKPLTALAVQRLRVPLDASANALLTSWKLRDGEGKPADHVTVEQLLTHRGGVNLHGFDGYARGEALPSPLQILEGGGNSPAVRVTMPAGRDVVYSGGGYQIVQQLLHDVTGESFEATMQRLVLQPAGMHDSTFAVPLPASLTSRAAIAHDAEGKPIAGGWREYPEQAAASLRTTAADLARLLLWMGEDFGRGFFTSGRGQHLSYVHDGAVAGAQCIVIGFPRLGKGAVILTNSANGLNLAPEILRALSRKYDWPAYRTTAKETVTVTEAELRALAGTYTDDDARVELAIENGRLVARSGWWRGARDVYAGREGRFFTLEGDWEMTFVRNEAGRVTMMEFGPVRLPRR